jgi:hypothetical protein
LVATFEVIPNYIANPCGGGGGMMLLLLMVLVDVCITVDQLHDKILCTSHPMILQLCLSSRLLERWTAGMHHIFVLLNNDILFHNLSLRITFFHDFPW